MDFPQHHKSGNLSYLFRFNTTLVRRVQPIYRRIAALGCILFCLCQSKAWFCYVVLNLLYSFNLLVERVFFCFVKEGKIGDNG